MVHKNKLLNSSTTELVHDNIVQLTFPAQNTNIKSIDKVPEPKIVMSTIAMNIPITAEPEKCQEFRDRRGCHRGMHRSRFATKHLCVKMTKMSFPLLNRSVNASKSKTLFIVTKVTLWQKMVEIAEE